MTFDLERRRSDTHIPEIVRRLQEAAYMRDDLWKQEHWKTMARDLLDDAAAEIMRLRERLELGYGFNVRGERVPCDADIDGIYCRDATIEMLEELLHDLRPTPSGGSG